MKIAGSTIWDTRVQGVTGVLTAQAPHGVEFFASATFGRLSDEPPRLIVSSNYKYPIDQAIIGTSLFAINVLASSRGQFVADVMKLRRRDANKARSLNVDVRYNHQGIPYLEFAHTVIFCMIERQVEAGDRRLYVAKVLEARSGAGQGRPLLFGEVLDCMQGVGPLQQAGRAVGNAIGLRDFARKIRRLRSNDQAVSIAERTYEIGGATRREIDQVLQQGLVDHSRRLPPPPPYRRVRDPVGICVVGSGWGALHCEWIRQINPNARLFVCGRNPEKTGRLARRVKAEGAFSDIRSAAEDARVSCLTVALPHDLHREAVEIAAAAGKHVLVEKPIATNLDDARKMIAAANRAGTILMVAENAHYRPTVHEAVRRIERGDIGEPLYMLVHGGGPLRPGGWKRDKDRMGGGVLIDIGVHYIRALRLLMGEPNFVSTSRAMQINTKLQGEDSVQLVFSSSAGWEAHMLLSWASYRGAAPDIVIAGDRGTLHLWPGKRYLDYYPIAPTLRSRLVSCVRPYWLQAKLSRPENQRMRIRLRDRDKSGYLGEMREFLACVAENRRPSSTAEEACRDLEIVLSSYESLEERRRVVIPDSLHSVPAFQPQATQSMLRPVV